MIITFDKEDTAQIRKKLDEAGISVSAHRIHEVLYNVEAAFQQQFGHEADYMINEFEADQ
jgi:hypothetical protein